MTLLDKSTHENKYFKYIKSFSWSLAVTVLHYLKFFLLIACYNIHWDENHMRENLKLQRIFILNIHNKPSC